MKTSAVTTITRPHKPFSPLVLGRAREGLDGRFLLLSDLTHRCRFSVETS